MVTILCVGDVHLSDVPPTNCTDSYNDDLFVMLAEIVAIAGRRGVDAVAFSGDVFHRKAPTRTSHRTVQRMIDVVQSFPCPVYIVPGNHDITNDRLESIASQPLGVLYQSGARMLDGWALDWNGTLDLPLFGVPWQQDWDHAGPAFENWRSVVSGARADGRRLAPLLVTHAPLYPPGQELPWENIPAPTVADWMNGDGFCYYGHVHPRHGTFTSWGVTFCNQGAISRGSLHEEDISRHPAVTIWHHGVAGEGAFERVELSSAPPASAVFRMAEAAKRRDYADRLETFLADVGRSQVSLTSVEQVIEHVRSLGLTASEQELAEEVLTSAAAGELK